MQRYQHLLAAVDFSDMGGEVIQHAQQMAELFDARLSLLHVVQDLTLAAEPFGEPAALVLGEEIRQQHLTRSQENLEALAAQHQLPLHVERAIETGFAAETIISFAEDKQVDLIVLAHSGKKGIFGLLGSTANAVVKSAKCDVLVVRHKSA